MHSSFYDELENEFVERGLRISHRFGAAEGLGRSGQIRADTDADVDPPQVVVAVDVEPVINSALGAVSPMVGDMLLTLAPTGIVFEAAASLQRLGSESAKLVIHCRRGRGRDDPQGVGAAVEALHRHGVTGATVLGRGEGTIAGRRYRPRLLSPSPAGPMMVVSIDSAEVFARAVPSLSAMPQVEFMTAKPISVCKWRGRREPPPTPGAGRPAWSQITLYVAGDTLLTWRPAHLDLVQRLRKLGAPGVTVLRGAGGYALRPERGRFERRVAPTVTTIVDTPDHVAQWLEAIDDITGDAGLVTHEFVSAHRLM